MAIVKSKNQTKDVLKEAFDNPSEVFKENFRSGVMELEDMIKDIDGSFEGDTSFCPLKHSFSDNMYVREIFIPKGVVLTGKIHKHDHPNFLMKGTVVVITEGKGKEKLKAPQSIISEAGTKRLLYAETDLVWITVHHNPTNTQDLKEIEKEVIADSYEEYEKFIGSKSNLLNKLKNLIIKKLLL